MEGKGGGGVAPGCTFGRAALQLSIHTFLGLHVGIVYCIDL